MNKKEEQTLPIREVSRLTGVNSITLRAWERRYGLLKPTRTDTGHRLYTASDVQRVKDIQAWLVRGLAVSQVKDILAQGNYPAAEADDPLGLTENVWFEHLARVEQVIARLDHKALEKLLHELVALYPAPLVADQLLTPLLERLHTQRRHGAQTQLAFLNSVASEYFWFGINRQRQTAHGARVLVIRLNPDDNSLLPLALSYCLLIKGFQAYDLGYLPPGEVVFAAERLGARGLMAYGDLASGVSVVCRQLAEWRQLLQIPVFLCGKLVPVYAARTDDGDNDIILAELLQSVTDAVSVRLGEA